MRVNQVKRKLEAGEPAVGLFVFLTDPHVVGTAAAVGLDFCCCCLEHGRMSHETLQNMVYAADAAGIEPFARVPDVSRGSILRALETGVRGLLLPWCESAETAAELVRQCRYPPVGRHGAYGNHYPTDYARQTLAEHGEIANREVLVMAQIESPEGVAAIDSIAAVDGLDVIMIGPGDLSYQLGKPQQWSDPEFLGACDRVVDVALAAGKQVGLAHTVIPMFERYLARGVKLWWWGQDLNSLRLQLVSEAKRLQESYGWRPNPGSQPGRSPLEA